MNWLKQLLGFRTKAESLALAKQEMAARDMRQSCGHVCATCDYLSLVYEITASPTLRIDCSRLKSAHVGDCFAGVPNSSACVDAMKPLR